MLKVDLGELLRQTGKYITVEVDDVPTCDEDVVYVGPAKGTVTISNSGSLVIVRGVVNTTIQLECGRCLGEVVQPIRAEIDEQYTLSDVAAGGSHDAVATIVGDDENELPPGLIDGTEMDLNVLIRQSTILGTPLSVLCKSDCLGFCPMCGKNRNLADNGCTCTPAEVKQEKNTPLAVLKQLYEQSHVDNASDPKQDQ